jgi:hypothetical protein
MFKKCGRGTVAFVNSPTSLLLQNVPRLQKDGVLFVCLMRNKRA